MIILPAYNIGNSELRFCVESLHNHRLLDGLLLVCPQSSLDSLPLPVPHVLADDMKTVDPLVDKIAAWAKLNDTRFQGLVGIDEELHFELSHRIADRFSLPFHKAVTLHRASNKYLCKEAFLEAGVPTSPFTLLSHPDFESAAKVGFPNVLKVLSGTQSQYLFRNDSFDQLVESFDRMTAAMAHTSHDPRFEKLTTVLRGESVTLDPRSQFLLEAYVHGHEYSCDFLVRLGHVEIVRVTKKVPGPLLGLFGAYLLLDTASLPGDGIDPCGLTRLCRSIAAAFELEDGMCMVDFKAHRGVLTVLESSVRPGFSAFNHLMYEVFGYTSLALMAAVAMGKPIPLVPQGSSRAVVYLIAPRSAEGAPLDPSRLAKRQQELGIVAMHLFDDDGDDALHPDVDATGLLRGYVLIENPDPARMIDVMAEINESVDYGSATDGSAKRSVAIPASEAPSEQEPGPRNEEITPRTTEAE